MIGGKPIDPDRLYTIANSDFIANGGDNADMLRPCLLYTSDAADERSSVDLGGRRIIKKKNKRTQTSAQKYIG